MLLMNRNDLLTRLECIKHLEIVGTVGDIGLGVLKNKWVIFELRKQDNCHHSFLRTHKYKTKSDALLVFQDYLKQIAYGKKRIELLEIEKIGEN